jgi:hypothetical protein
MAKKILRQIRVAVINSTLNEPYHSYGDHWVDGFQDAGAIVDVFRYDTILTVPLKYDLYFFVEVRYDPTKIPWHMTPRVLYSWDAHILGSDYYKSLCSYFDWICLASKIDTDKLIKERFNNVVWIPEACNPRLHKDLGLDRIYDIGLVGRHNETYIREGYSKTDFINFLSTSKYKNFFKTEVWGKSYVDLMNQTILAFDRAVSHNVGTRVFESAAMGCLPLWSEFGVSNLNGMSSLMKPWQHYIPYTDTIESLVQTVDILLSNKKDIEYLRNEAKNHVLENHTYAHRCIDILKQINIQMETK